jgi:hypothetical protein
MSFKVNNEDFIKFFNKELSLLQLILLNSFVYFIDGDDIFYKVDVKTYL